MQAPRVSLVVSPGATTPLRFDDPEWLDAIARDGEGEGRGTLASVLEVPKAADIDFSPYVDDGYVLHVRPAVRTGDRLDQFSVGQRQGGGVDIRTSAARLWADWVMGVEVGDHVDQGAGLKPILSALGSSNRKTREDAYLTLPSHVGAHFLGRLRAHIDAVGRPADRDPGKLAPLPAALGEAPSPSLDTGNNWSGDQSQSDGAGR